MKKKDEVIKVIPMPKDMYAFDWYIKGNILYFRFLSAEAFAKKFAPRPSKLTK